MSSCASRQTAAAAAAAAATEYVHATYLAGRSSLASLELGLYGLAAHLKRYHLAPLSHSRS